MLSTFRLRDYIGRTQGNGRGAGCQDWASRNKQVSLCELGSRLQGKIFNQIQTVICWNPACWWWNERVITTLRLESQDNYLHWTGWKDWLLSCLLVVFWIFCFSWNGKFPLVERWKKCHHLDNGWSWLSPVWQAICSKIQSLQYMFNPLINGFI